MRPTSLALVALALVAAQTFGQETKPAPTYDQVKQDPDNKDTLNAFIVDNLRAVSGMLRTNPTGAEKKLAEFQKSLDGLAPKADDAKQMLDRAKNALKFYHEQLELAKSTLGELQEKVKAAPDDVATINRYISKLTTEMQVLARSDAAEANKQIASAREFLGGLNMKAVPAAKTVIERGLPAYLDWVASETRP